MSRALRTLGVPVAALLVCGLLGTGPAVARQAARPAVGQCHHLTLEQARERSNPEAPVACRRAHTAQVIAVPTLPAKVTWTSDQKARNKAIRATCDKALDRAVGANPLQVIRAQYGWFWFEPTPAQKAGGARWYSCHAIVRKDDGLARLAAKLVRLSNKLPDSIARCITRKNRYTTCADAHAWRSSYAFYVTGRATHTAIEKAAKRTCPRHVKGKGWRYSAWDIAGKRFVVACYTKTRR